MLSRFSKKITRFLSSDDGPTAVEYAILLAIIVGTVAASVGYVGSEVKTAHETIGTALKSTLNK